MRKLIVLISSLAALSGTAAQAQTLVELRPFAGMYLPTGNLRDVVGDAMLLGGQAALEVENPVHLVGSFGFTAPTPRHLSSESDLHVYQADFGVETFRNISMGENASIRPFFGVGIGGRILEYEETHSYLNGYASVGTEFQRSRLAVRVEARNYLTHWEGLLGDQNAKWRHDLMLTAGASLHLAALERAAPQRAAQPAQIELRPFMGVYLPTGKQRDGLKDAALFGIQGAIEMADQVHLVGTLAYTSPATRNMAVSEDVRLYQADVGAEVFRQFPFRGEWNMRPFAGLGLGVRTNDFQRGQSQFAGYGSVGTELQRARVGLRLELRDYMTRFKGPLGDQGTAWRNDMMMVAGASFHF